MKAISCEKQSIAWFKLAECVERGEKERALNLFRLLTHSLSDQAFKKQLEADIVASFDKNQALVMYTYAAHLYDKYGKTEQAALLYEYMIMLEPRREFLEKAFLLAQELHHQTKKNMYARLLCYAYAQSGDIDQAKYYLDSIYDHITAQEKIELISCWIFQALTHTYDKQEIIESLLYALLDLLVQFSTDKELQLFYARLQILNTWWFARALEYTKR